METTESSFKHQDITHTTVTEKDEGGNQVCSGCHEVLPIPTKAYSQAIWLDEKTCKHYSVHKYCNAKSNHGEGIKLKRQSDDSKVIRSVAKVAHLHRPDKSL